MKSTAKNIVKQVIVLRTDLNMRKGKMVAQGAHASLMAILGEQYRPGADLGVGGDWLLLGLDDDLRAWLLGDYKKICVGVTSEPDLINVFNDAVTRGLRCSLIRDNGLTEFDGVQTYTAVAVGPGNAELVDLVTGHLGLL